MIDVDANISDRAFDLDIAATRSTLFSFIKNMTDDFAVLFGAMTPMAEKLYVFEYFLRVSRSGDPPNPWVWEIRSKRNPEGRYFSGQGFRSAKSAEEAGKIVLAEVRKVTFKDHAAAKAIQAFERSLREKISAARKVRKPLTPERRSENARIAANARAKALSAERRSEIARLGGAASKGKPKSGKRSIAPIDSQ
jgi:hypothetical protein